MTMTSKSAKAKYNEEMNQFLMAGNGPAGMAMYQISIVRPHQLHKALAGDTMAIAQLNVLETFLHREQNKPMLCGACDNTIDGNGAGLIVIIPGSEPKAGTACVSPVCPNCADLDDTKLLAKATPYLRKMMPDGRIAEMSGSSGTA
jgi:hypothetical protein